MKENYTDNWGQNPEVQHLRRVFSRIEAKQSELLQKLKITTFDYRLRRVREATLSVFEKAWATALRRGLALNEEEIVSLYLFIFSRMLNANRIHAPRGAPPSDSNLASLVREILP